VFCENVSAQSITILLIDIEQFNMDKIQEGDPGSRGGIDREEKER
jgi:hypothetical protein